MKVHVLIGRGLFVLICTQGAWRCLSLKISNEWFRLFYYMIHIGKIIEKEFYRQGRSVSWFANKLCCDRTNVYNIFKRESIDTALLIKISRTLGHNFFAYYMEDMERV